jgi:hypothetical protein
MIYNGASGRAGVSMPSVMNEPYLRTESQPLLTRAAAKISVWMLFLLVTLRLGFNFVRLIWLSVPFLRPECIPRMTFQEWTEYSVPNGIIPRWTGMDNTWKDFTSQILVPLFSAVCTAAENDVMNHPVEEFLGMISQNYTQVSFYNPMFADYVWLTFGTHHYVVINGVREVVCRLTSSLEHILLSSPISSISYCPSTPHLLSIHCACTTFTGFSHIIFATQASSAVELLSSYLSSLPPTSTQRENVEAQITCLQTFEYRHTVVINHTDDTLQPHNIRDRRDLNLIFLDTSNSAKAKLAKAGVHAPSHCVPTTYSMATHVLPAPASYPQVYQTTNPIIPPCEDSILSVAKLERAVVTLRSKKALSGLYLEESRRWWQCAGYGVSGLGALQGAGKLMEKDGQAIPGIWLCGSYAYAGIPLLEGCVGSARNVVEKGVLKSEGVAMKVW